MSSAPKEWTLQGFVDHFECFTTISPRTMRFRTCDDVEILARPLWGDSC